MEKPAVSLPHPPSSTRGLAALREASERVRARYGFACTRTDEEASKLQQRLARYGRTDRVEVREFSHEVREISD